MSFVIRCCFTSFHEPKSDIVLTSAVVGFAAAAPVAQANYRSRPDVGYTGADAPYVSATPPAVTEVATTFGPDSTISAILTNAPTGTMSGAAGLERSTNLTGPTSIAMMTMLYDILFMYILGTISIVDIES